MSEHGPLRRGRVRRPVVWTLLAVLVIVVAAGLWAFQPWRLLTHSTVNEAVPGGPATTSTAPPPPGSPNPTPTGAAPATTVLAEGAFVSQEHGTTGTARVLALPDGSRVLRLEGFATSDGPDLHVWLTDQEAGGDWHKYDDGRYLALGALKATGGNQNYPIPADAQLGGLHSVVIWCDRFNVAFGSAPLRL